MTFRKRQSLFRMAVHDSHHLNITARGVYEACTLSATCPAPMMATRRGEGVEALITLVILSIHADK